MDKLVYRIVTLESLPAKMAPSITDSTNIFFAPPPTLFQYSTYQYEPQINEPTVWPLQKLPTKNVCSITGPTSINFGPPIISVLISTFDKWPHCLVNTESTYHQDQFNNRFNKAGSSIRLSLQNLPTNETPSITGFNQVGLLHVVRRSLLNLPTNEAPSITDPTGTEIKRDPVTHGP